MIMSTIAFIGLGRMGHPMAQNLLASGFNVQVFDVDSEAAKQLAPFGAVVANSIEEVVDGASTVITMLPAGSHVRSVYLGDLHGGVGVLNLVSPSTLMIDCSTIDPDSARLVANEAANKRVLFVDAPVSGGVAGAKAATLTFIVGGSDEAFSKANAILQYMGKNVFHAGKALARFVFDRHEFVDRALVVGVGVKQPGVRVVGGMGPIFRTAHAGPHLDGLARAQFVGDQR